MKIDDYFSAMEPTLHQVPAEIEGWLAGWRLPCQKTFDHFMQLSFFLEELLGRRAELVTPESVSPHIRPHILAEVENVFVAG